MTDNDFPYQPGVMLHEAIVGAFRASGGSFEVWCVEHGVTPSIARNATYGVMKGPKGRELLGRLAATPHPEARVTCGLRVRASHPAIAAQPG